MSNIEWTEKTWNPIIGCSHCSPGCLHCYAERMAVRLSGNPNTPQYKGVIHDGKWSGKTAFVESALEIPMKRRKPTLYFVCSMGDLFHPSVPDEWITRVFSVMATCPDHRFLILTKRPERIAKCRKNIRPLPNVGYGTTVCNQEEADRNIPFLLSIPGPFHFVSFEPALGPVNFTPWIPPFTNCDHYDGGCTRPENVFAETGNPSSRHGIQSCKPEYCVFGRPGLDWIIIGGESGPDARPMNPGWVRSVVKQCHEAHVPVFFKQWGEYVPVVKDFSDMEDLWIGQDEETYPSFNVVCDNPRIGYVLVGKKRAGHLLDGNEVRDWPKWLEGYHG